MNHWGSRTRAAAAALALLPALVAGRALAQEAPPAGDAAAGPATGTCTFDVREQPIGRVLEYVRRASHGNVVVAPEAEKETVTLKVTDMPWRSALDEIARRTGCTIEEYPDLLRVEKPPRVSFSFEGAPIDKVIRTIAALSGANIVADPDDVKGSVTVNLIDVPWRDALTAIVGSKGFTVVEEKGRILRVVSPGKLSAQMETRIYPLKFLHPPPNYAAKLPTSQVVEFIATRVVGDVEKTFTVIIPLREALQPGGGLQYIQASNALVLKGTKPQLAAVEKMLAVLDKEPMQVFVDMQFVTTRNSDLFQMGLGPGEAGLGGSMTMSKIEGGVRFPFNTGAGGFEDYLLAADNQPPVGSANPIVSYGNLDFSASSLILKILKNDIKSRVVQAPKLFALDNQEATIFVGETIRFAQSEAKSSQSGGVEFSIREADKSPVSTGFQLILVPHVIPESNKVLMTLVPTQNDLAGSSAELPGFDKFSVGGAGAEQTIFLPHESTSTMMTTLICEHGTTAVLGGLMKESQAVTTNKVPWLGDLPFFGYLFKTESKNKETKQLMIFITPWLVKDASGQRKSLEEDLLRREPGLDDEWQRLMEGGPGDEAVMLVPAKGEPAKEPVKEAPAPEKKPTGVK